jgi:hypothetical protein
MNEYKFTAFFLFCKERYVCGASAWGLGGMATASNRKRPASYEMLYTASRLGGSCEQSNELRTS